MKITSTITSICIIVSLLAIVGKAFHMDGMAFLLIVFLGIASMIFFLETLLSVFYFGGHSKIIAISVLACLGLSTLVVGVLFRLLFWPGSGPMLIAGMLPVIIALILAGINQDKIQSMDDSKQKVLTRGIILPAVVFLVLGLLAWFAPEDVFWSLFSSQSAR